MKTSELIKRVQELSNGLSVEFPNKIAVLFADNKQTPICEVDDNIISTYKDRFAVNSPISNAIELMFEYAKTPLEEREEEKKYRLKVNCNNFQCLNFHTVLKDYCISNIKPLAINVLFSQNTPPSY